MWQYSGTDVPVCDFSLTNNFGMGHTNTIGFNQPTFWNNFPVFGTVPFGTPQLGYTPFVHPYNIVKNDWTPFVQPMNMFRTDVLPFIGQQIGYTPLVWNTPFGFDRLNTWKIDNLGINPWFVSNPYFGLKLTEEIWKNTLPFSTPIYGQTLPFVNTLGYVNTPFNVTVNPFWNVVDEKVKFNTPYTTGIFGFNTTPFTTPFDWKLKTFGTPIGMTEGWNKPMGTTLPWTSRIPSPVAVL